MPHANTETYSMPPGAPPQNHGRTTAAWVMFWGIVVGLVIAVLGFVLPNTPILIAGIVVIAAALVASMVLRKSGRGQPLERRHERAWYED